VWLAAIDVLMQLQLVALPKADSGHMVAEKWDQLVQNSSWAWGSKRTLI
jgi:hypothetical protein